MDHINENSSTIVTGEGVVTTTIRGRAGEGAVRKAEVIQSKEVTENLGLSFNEQGEEI